jgi:hypothetical protein
MAIPTLYDLDGEEIEIRHVHWQLWGEMARGTAVAGPRLAQVHIERGPVELHSVRQLFGLTPRDEDLAEAIGQGVRRLDDQIPSKALAVRSRFVAWSEHVAMKDLARRFGVTPARVSQMADEGMAVVERWVRDAYGAG